MFRSELLILPVRHPFGRSRRRDGRCKTGQDLDVLANVPHAYADEVECSGDGWRIVPATSYEDWPVLEATPQRLRAAFQTARRLLWANAGPVGISAGEIIDVDSDIDSVLNVLHQAEARGYSVNLSYVSLA